MIPFYIFYSMFGFQRTGDQFWQLADQLGRGFVLGATAGRTTLTGEGLQHADGHSLLLASSNPACVAYDPAFVVRDRAHRAGRRWRGCTAVGAFDSQRGLRSRRLLLPDDLQRADRASRRSRSDLDVERAAARHLPLLPRAGEQRPPALPAAGLGRRDAVGAGGAADARRGVGRRRRRVVGDVLERAAPRRRRLREARSCIRTTSRARRSSPRSSPTPSARWSRCRTSCARYRTRSAAGCPTTTPRWAPTGSASPTPAVRPVGSSTSTRSRSWSRRSSSWPGVARSRREAPREAFERYQLDSVSAAGAGNTEGSA